MIIEMIVQTKSQRNRWLQFVDKRGSELKNSEPLLKFL